MFRKYLLLICVKYTSRTTETLKCKMFFNQIHFARLPGDDLQIKAKTMRKIFIEKVMFWGELCNLQACFKLGKTLKKEKTLQKQKQALNIKHIWLQRRSDYHLREKNVGGCWGHWVIGFIFLLCTRTLASSWVVIQWSAKVIQVNFFFKVSCVILCNLALGGKLSSVIWIGEYYEWLICSNSEIQQF